MFWLLKCQYFTDPPMLPCGSPWCAGQSATTTLEAMHGQSGTQKRNKEEWLIDYQKTV